MTAKTVTHNGIEVSMVGSIEHIVGRMYKTICPREYDLMYIDNYSYTFGHRYVFLKLSGEENEVDKIVTYDKEDQVIVCNQRVQSITCMELPK